MIPFDLNKFCQSYRLNPVSNEPITIKKTATSVLDMSSNTLIFNLHKTHSLNVERLKKIPDCFIVTDQPPLKTYQPVKKRFIIAADVEALYLRFIEDYRKQFKIKTIAVTGTCGKSTTKEMIKQVLEKRYRTKGTVLSRNALRFNHDYLMEIGPDTKFGVYETALTDPGQIIYSGKFYQPKIGIITNIGIDHLSGCRTLENYILAKAEMLTVLGDDGTLIINNDCENTAKIDFSSFKGLIMTTGIKNKAMFSASEIKYHDKFIGYTLKHANNTYNVSFPGNGEHDVYNSLQALTALTACGLNLADTVKAIAGFRPLSAHFEIMKGINGSLIVDDTWSSNPTSVKAAFAALQKLPGEKAAVLGNISYLGHNALEYAREIGKMAIEYGIGYVVAIDNFSKVIADEAVKHGLKPNHAFYCQTYHDLDSVLLKLFKPGVVTLFKTSMFERNIKNLIRKYLVK